MAQPRVSFDIQLECIQNYAERCEKGSADEEKRVPLLRAWALTHDPASPLRRAAFAGLALFAGRSQKPAGIDVRMCEGPNATHWPNAVIDIRFVALKRRSGRPIAIRAG